MTDPKIPAPEPCAWADDRAAAGASGTVISAPTKKHWMCGAYGTHAFRATAERLTNPLCTLAAAETYAAALAEKARQEEQERLHTLAQQMMDEATEGNWAQAAVIMEQMLRAG